jgi:hydrogenase maturation protein HypF
MADPKDERAISAAIRVKGVVQGVGFRPFVYRLALAHDLKGWVCNTSADLRIEVEGTPRQISGFLSRLRSEPPPLSRIEEVQCEYLGPRGLGPFEIRASISEEGCFQRISPDMATCDRCREEIFDPADRRFRYPFTNCTHCGPRLTIIRDTPYDRPKTTMGVFQMCPECRREYEDPLNRRFHAQPNCCPRCGPALVLADRAGGRIECQDPISEASVLLSEGKIVAMKGLGGFLLVCDAGNEETVRELRRRKNRPYKPFAVMTASLEQTREICALSREEEELLTSPIAPIVLLRLLPNERISPAVAPGLNYLGVMLPYTPLHHLLMEAARRPLVMTSGNLSEEPMVSENQEALEKLASIADRFLLHDRGIYARCDDSVVMMEDRAFRVLRRARGYAPDPVILEFETSEVLACGAEIKNTFCMTRDRYAFLSQHIGDMENLETLEHFEAMVDLYRRMYRIHPRIVAHDLHPDYLSTHYARGLKEKDEGITLVPVQHHHAHVVSCLIENRLRPPALGVAFDGTGYGPDQTVWGGEFLLLDGYDRMRRAGHLEPIPLPGGDAAVKRPYRMALSYLFSLFGEQTLSRGHRFLRGKDERELALVVEQIRKGIQTPWTSSAGRLFDGVSALIGVRDRIDYEGQAAIELEMACAGIPDLKEGYPFGIQERDGKWVLRLHDLFEAILKDLDHGIGIPEISARFHLSVARMISRTAAAISRATGIRLVALSGGTFQNRVLLGLARSLLEEEGLQVATHREVPCNDGGISLGQAVVAHFATKTKGA